MSDGGLHIMLMVAGPKEKLERYDVLALVLASRALRKAKINTVLPKIAENPVECR